MRPEISVPYLQKAIRFAAAIGAPVVNTDEGIRPSWVGLDDAWRVMSYTLTTALRTAERYGVYIGIEPHQSISQTTGGLLPHRHPGGFALSQGELRHRQRVPRRRRPLRWADSRAATA